MYEADANDLDMHDIHNGDSVQSEHVTEVPNQSEGRRNQISVANCIGKCLLQILMKHATAVMSPLIYIFLFQDMSLTNTYTRRHMCHCNRTVPRRQRHHSPLMPQRMPSQNRNWIMNTHRFDL